MVKVASTKRKLILLTTIFNLIVVSIQASPLVTFATQINEHIIKYSNSDLVTSLKITPISILINSYVQSLTTKITASIKVTYQRYIYYYTGNSNSFINETTFARVIDMSIGEYVLLSEFDDMGLLKVVDYTSGTTERTLREMDFLEVPL